jgi:hypothetical protein
MAGLAILVLNLFAIFLNSAFLLVDNLSKRASKILLVYIDVFLVEGTLPWVFHSRNVFFDAGEIFCLSPSTGSKISIVLKHLFAGIAPW